MQFEGLNFNLVATGEHFLTLLKQIDVHFRKEKGLHHAELWRFVNDRTQGRIVSITAFTNGKVKVELRRENLRTYFSPRLAKNGGGYINVAILNDYADSLKDYIQHGEIKSSQYEKMLSGADDWPK